MGAIGVAGNHTGVDGVPEDWVEAGTRAVEAKMRFSLLALERCILQTLIARASFRVAAVTFSHFTKWLTRRSSFEAIALGAIMVGCCMTVVKTDSEVSAMPYKAAANSRNKTHSLPGTPLRNEAHSDLPLQTDQLLDREALGSGHRGTSSTIGSNGNGHSQDKCHFRQNGS